MNFLVPERRTCTHSLPCLEAVPDLGHWVTGLGCLGVALRQTAIPGAAQCSPPLASQRDLLVCCLLQTIHKGDGPGWERAGRGHLQRRGSLSLVGFPTMKPWIKKELRRLAGLTFRLSHSRMQAWEPGSQGAQTGSSPGAPHRSQGPLREQQRTRLVHHQKGFSVTQLFSESERNRSSRPHFP